MLPEKKVKETMRIELYEEIKQFQKCMNIV